MAVNGTITTAGAAYLSQRISAMATVTIDHFVMANVPGIDETTEADQHFVLAEEDIVATAPVYRLAHNGENSVVYSMVLDGNAGDYDFNWYGLVTNTGVILAFAHIPPVAKRANVGQVINRNFILPFTAAKALTGADIPSESWQFDFTESIAEVTVSLLGPKFVYKGDTYNYTFTDWDNFSTYSVSSSVGSVLLGVGELTLDIPEEVTDEECLMTIIRNGSTRIIPIRIGDPIVAAPTLIAPIDGADSIRWAPELVVSPFKTFPAGADVQASADWELYDANETLVFSSYDNQTGLSSIQLPDGILDYGGYGYNWRVRHNGVELGDGEWSELFGFVTGDELVPGGAMEGGYFAGYMNPTDGPRYALIISPKDSGENSLKFNTDGSSVTGTDSFWDGLSNTENIMSHHTASRNEAAIFCAGLTIAGFDDWYLPSLDELELMYRNLKPSDYENYVGGQHGTSYQAGYNPSSEPPGGAYTATSPQQTSVSVFQFGGAEAFRLEEYWTSNQYSGRSDWAHASSFLNGNQENRGKTQTKPVRAVRRVLME